MKRHLFTKASAVIAAFLVMTASALLPVTAAAPLSLTLCTAEAVGSDLPFDITASAAEGNMNNPGKDGSATENLLPGDSTSGTADDAVGGNDPVGDTGNTPSSGSTSGTTGDAAGDPNAGNGNREEGQAGGNSDGMIGEGPAVRPEDTAGTDPNTPDTTDNPVENAVDKTADAVDNADGGTGWGSIIVALLIAAALIVVIVALIPRRRTD